MLESAYGKKMSIEKYENFLFQSTKSQSIYVNKQSDLFMRIFCNYLDNDINSAPIFLDLSKLKDVISKLGEVKSVDNNGYDLFDHIIKKCKNNDEKFHLTKIADIYNDYMLVFCVTENPNKFLWEALNTRRQKNFIDTEHPTSFLDELLTHDVADSSDKFYMGLDRVAQFLNFCVMLRGLPKRLEENSKVVVEPKPLQFEARVLAELLHQFDQDLKAVNKIFNNNERAEFEVKLKNLHKEYDKYCSEHIGEGQRNLMPFAKWINPMVQEENRHTAELYLFPIANGINNKNELIKLLKLDAVLQAEKAINQFIDSKAVDSQTLNWFQKLWNHIVNGTFIANNWGWFFKEKKVSLLPNKFIPRLDKFEDKETKSSEDVK